MASETASGLQNPRSVRAANGSSVPAVAYRHVDEHLTSLLRPTSPDAEQYRVLRHRLEQLRATRGIKLIGVTSPAMGDGKTTTALNLAGTIAQNREARVLVVDADLRRPAVARYLGMGGEGPGLVEAILHPVLDLNSLIRHRPAFNLSVLPAGRCPTLAYEILRSPRVPALLEQAREAFDYVILDTPPVLLMADSRLVADWVDGMLVVVTAHKSPRKLLAETLSVLEPAKVLGLILNGDERPLAGYYKAYYRAYYGNDRKKGAGGS